MNTKVSIEFEVSDELCASILSTAIEGGIGYWSQVEPETRYDASHPLYYKSAKIHEFGDSDEEQSVHEVDYDKIREALKVIITSPDFNQTKQDAIRAITEHDGGHFDANSADVVIQVACFGETVYG
jgi:hypothetical protein